MGEGKGGLVRDNLVMGEQLLSAGHKSKGTAFKEVFAGFLKTRRA